MFKWNNGFTNIGIVRGSYSNKWGTYSVTIGYPSAEPGPNAAPDRARAPYAVVVFAHGILANKDLYKWIGKQLTRRGYVTLLFTTPRPWRRDVEQWSQGISSAITYLDEVSHTGVLTGMVDQARIGVMGHSMGGAAVILATANDPRIECTVALSPPCFGTVLKAARALRGPVQIQVGSRDRLTPKYMSRQLYSNLPGPAPKEYVEIKDAGHVRFTDIGPWILSPIDLGPTLSLERTHEISQSFFIPWFGYFLQRDPAFETSLFGSEAQSALKSGALSALEWVKP